MRIVQVQGVDLSQTFDVLVVGGGCAGLCAAVTAGEAGALVLLAEHALPDARGGDSRHCRTLRLSHEGGNEFLSGSYPELEFWEDLLQVTGGQTNEQLARLLIRQSKNLGDWLVRRGIRFAPPAPGGLHISRGNAALLGEGTALVNALSAAARKTGVEMLSGAEVRQLNISGSRFHSAGLAVDGRICDVQARTVVVASGGFQANRQWLQQFWGAAADNFIVCGTPLNTGTMLRALLDHGALVAGDPRQCHAAAIDARAPKADGGAASRLDGIPLGIMVNRHGERFIDEGEDFWAKRFATWGLSIARQPEQIAWALFDARSIDQVLPTVFPAYEAGSVGELADKLGLARTALESTVTAFNAATRLGSFDPLNLDSCVTSGLQPAKSHWARPLDSPPYYGYPLRPGIGFTYMGVAVNERAQVLRQNSRPFDNIFAAGEIAAGNILGKGYLAGLQLTMATVFGRIAGEEAARLGTE